MKNHLRRQLMGLDDADLVRHIQAGQSSQQLAASLLLERYRALLLRRCRARLGNYLDAEEALQETLWRAFRGIKCFKGGSDISVLALCDR